MAEQTTNYKLIKPALTDIPDITAMNPNWDTIDAELKDLDSKIENIAQPDWSQNDETAPDYIKNRTHYRTINENKVIFDEVCPVGTSGKYPRITLNNFFIKPYIEYTVTLNEVSETATSIANSAVGINGRVFGEITGDGGVSQHNVRSYLTVASPEPYTYIFNDSILTGLTECHVKIEENVDFNYQPIPVEYLPYKSIENGEGDYGTIIGDKNNQATGNFSLAEGYNTTASGFNSHAEGSGSIASGSNSHAEGFSSIASGGYGPHAEGYQTTASGNSAHSEGIATIASKSSSHAEGYQTIAASNYQHAQGKNNIEDANEKYAHIVGNGTSTSKRSNAHTLDWNGLGWFAGGLKVGGTSQDDTSAKEVALKDDIPDISNLALKTEIPDVDSYITTHNTSTASHNDIRDLITGLTNRLNALADSDDTTLDQLSEIVTYIKSNKELIDAITTSKVNVDDIVNNLTTNVSNKPLSAAQGVALKSLIDAITVPTKVSELTNDSGYLTSYTETDPTVPAWAKAASKPTYTATEVGADASGTANSVVSTHNTSTESHPDIREALANKVNQGDITLSSFGITATAAELNYVDGVTSNIQTQLTNKAPKNHASTATTYGASSASNYGHAMASSTTPKANGAAAVGTETAKFARGDHIHPAQTEITGNAGSATKLQTARTINGIAFDGTADIVVPSSVKIGTITLTASGWVEDTTLGAFKQTAAIPNLANGHKVDLDADLNTINQLPASIVPYNDNGTFYAVTLTPPSVDIAVQYTLLATN